MSDSLDGGIGHASDPGSIDGQAFAVEKTTIANGTTNTKKNAKAAKNQSRQSSQTTAAEDKPKDSWSEHVWSKFVSFKKIFSISLVSLKKCPSRRYALQNCDVNRASDHLCYVGGKRLQLR